jgi:hypothetical protein
MKDAIVGFAWFVLTLVIIAFMALAGFGMYTLMGTWMT